MNLEDRILLLEEKMKAVEQFMVSHRHNEEFEAMVKAFPEINIKIDKNV